MKQYQLNVFFVVLLNSICVNIVCFLRNCDDVNRNNNPAKTKHFYNICTTPALYNCYTNVLCLLKGIGFACFEGILAYGGNDSDGI